MTEKTLEQLKAEWVAADEAADARIDAYYDALDAQEKSND